MLYEEAFSRLFKDKRAETTNFYLNQDEQNLFKFDSIYNYFDVDKLLSEEETHNNDTRPSNNLFDDILDDIFSSHEDNDVDTDELEKFKREIFSDLVCNDILDVLQSYLDGTEKAHKSVAKEYIKDVAPGYVEKQIDAQGPNLGKETTELMKIFKKRQSLVNN